VFLLEQCAVSKLQQVIEVRLDTCTQSFCYSFIVLSITLFSKLSLKFDVQMC